MQTTGPMTESSETAQIFTRGARSAGAELHRLTSQNPTSNEAVAALLAAPPGREAANTAALLVIHALTNHPSLIGTDRRTAAKQLQRIWKNRTAHRPHPSEQLACQILQALTNTRTNSFMARAHAAALMVRRANGQTGSTGEAAGQALQNLIPLRSERSVFHTKEAPATLMAHMAIPGHPGTPGNTELKDLKDLKDLKIADYSCGAGTLLTAAIRRLHALHQQAGENPQNIHRHLLQNSITGTDISPAAIALTTDALASLAPQVHFTRTRLSTFHYGPPANTNGQQQPAPGLGALDILDQAASQHGREAAARHGAKNDLHRNCFSPRSQDAILMNPPFAKSSSLQAMAAAKMTPDTLATLREAVKRLRSAHNGQQNISLSFYFAMLATKNIRRGGTIALVLPLTALAAATSPQAALKNSANGWQHFRNTLLELFNDITVVTTTQYREQHASFSHNTSIAETIVTARKLQKGEKPERTVTFVNLAHMPHTPEEAASTAVSIRQAREDAKLQDTVRMTQHGNDQGHVTRVRLPKNHSWPMSRMLNQELINTITNLERGHISMDNGVSETHPPAAGQLPMISMQRMGQISAKPREILKETGGWIKTSPPATTEQWPMLHGHDSTVQRSMTVHQMASITLDDGQATLHRSVFEQKASRMHLNDSFRFNSQAMSACLTPEPAIGGTGWSAFNLHDPAEEKPIVLWLNTTVGLINHWSASNHAQNGLGHTSKGQLNQMPILDLRSLGRRKLDMMTRIFDEHANTQLMPACEAWQDPARQEIDRLVLRDVLGLDSQSMSNLEDIRNKWCQEPTVRGRKSASTPQTVSVPQPTPTATAPAPALASERPTATATPHRTPSRVACPGRHAPRKMLLLIK